MLAAEMTDAELARALALETGRLLTGLRSDSGLTGRALGHAGDQRANQLILEALGKCRPGDAILSEEGADSHERLRRSRVWIVDPLDGTREYAEGRADWAVHVGLAVDGAPACGAVALSAYGQCHSSDAAMQGSRTGEARLRLTVSRTRPPVETAHLAAALDAEIVPMGSAGAKAMAVLSGRADIYFHSGGQHEWDNCAPVAVALAAGLHASRADGSPLLYNQPRPYVPDLLICRSEVAQRALEALASF
jgi:3'(2'), 5'-bisphosphate nucleotidase